MFRRLARHLIKRGQVGQSIVILALGMIGLLGFVGITTDVSLLFVRYATLRRSVDSAAIAAAGQIRQSGSDAEFSDVIARAGLSARQFIEFHGLDPQDVWVEMCENQPRADNHPAPGVQTAPFAVTENGILVDAAVENLQAAIGRGETGDPEKAALDAAREAYIDSMIQFMDDENVPMSDSLQLQQDAYEIERSDWLSDPDNWNILDSQARRFIGGLEAESLRILDDTEICTPDQRKLVRVTAQIESPTAFLRIFGWDNITLEASAISETAVLDVIMVMDVSESMLMETNYNDWAEVNLGMAYIPPQVGFLNDQDNPNTVMGQLLTIGYLPNIPGQPGLVHPIVADTDLFTALPPQGTEYYFDGQAPPPTAGTWLEWFWLDYILGNWQSELNARLNFVDGSGNNIDGLTVQDKPTMAETGDPYNQDFTQPLEYYTVQSFLPSDVPPPQGHPRPACRVRFYPYSRELDMITDWPAYSEPDDDLPDTIAQLYDQDGGLSPADWPDIDGWLSPNNTDDDPFWDMYVPTYNFYGCCNDPASGVAVADGLGDVANGRFIDAATGNPLDTTIPTSDADGDFSDLVCQPFKDARDATRAFLQRIDFLRGDRVGFVTFDRSAFLIDPDGDLPGESHMIEDYETAVDTLNRMVGVRAEPNFYDWNEEEGGWVTGNAADFAAGIDPITGDSIPVDYGYDPAEDLTIPIDDDPDDGIEPPPADLDNPAAVNYPAFSSCFVLNAALRYPYSQYATRNVPPNTITATSGQEASVGPYVTGRPALLRNMQPDYDLPRWENITNNLTGNLYDFDSDSQRIQRSYERHGMCRGTNIGAALRQASAALTDPTTTRREGAVWIIVLLSDGAAGASDPVRSQGLKRQVLDLYEEVERFDWRERFVNAPSPPSLNVFDDGDTNRYSDAPGNYGAYGLCPFGFAPDITATPPDTRLARVGELVQGDANRFPWCSDPDPVSRHFCLPSDNRVVGWVENPAARWGEGFTPDSQDRDYIRIEPGSGIAPDAATYLADANYDADGNGTRDEDENTPINWVRPYPPDMPDADFALFEDFERPPRIYEGTRTDWLVAENIRLGNLFEVDIGVYGDPDNSCDVLYDVDDYARDWADFIAGVDEEIAPERTQLPTIFTIGFGLRFENLANGGQTRCEANMEDCLGEELLRYIADAGDNFNIDNDVQQDFLDDADRWQTFADSPGNYALLDGSPGEVDGEGWGPKDPCEPDDYGDFGSGDVWRGHDNYNQLETRAQSGDLPIPTRTAGESCGNYYNAPNLAELERVFDEIASRMFTRLAG
jgi:hypothetical protein